MQIDKSIAIIGMSGRFPQAPDLDRFWELLRDGRHAMERVPDFMLESRRAANGQLPSAYVPIGTYLADTEYFDCSLFGLSRREAMMIDPQQRLFIEQSYLAAEDAGYDISALGCRVGVYSGAGPSRHALDAMEVFGHDSATMFEVIATGIDKPMSMRVSHLFDLKGESLYVYAACATSLVAIDLAVNSLIEGRVDAAICGAACLYLPQMEGYDYVEGAVRSSDGFCRAFDAAADGTVWGNGVGVVVLKPLDKAIADGDRVRAVILGSSVNNDGASKASFAAPSVDGQAEVIRTAMQRAGVTPSDIDFVEAHGTGTPVGDPIEVASLNHAFGKGRGTDTCVLGSVKTNIGHLDPAAGVAGLIKTVLALENETIPATVHFHSPHPRIDFASGPFKVYGEPREWARGERPRRAGINSFGVGGTNAHVVLSEAPERSPRPISRRNTHLITLSARTETALETARAQLCSHMERNSDLDLRDIAFTRNAGRRQFRYSLGVLATNLHELRDRLNSARPFSFPKRSPKVAFVFPGQGSQTIAMCAALYESEPVFRDAFDRCSLVLVPLLGFDIRDVVFPEQHSEAKAEKILLTTSTQQPVLFTVSWSLCELLAKFGVKAETYIGHSVGEFVAAVRAGSMSVETALRILVARGAAIQSCEPGQMISVSTDSATLTSFLPYGVDIAAVNAPNAIVASGPENAIDLLSNSLREEGIKHVKLATSHAFHSRHVQSAVEAVRRAVAAETLTRPNVYWYSTISGQLIDDADAADPNYWAGQVIKPVLFAEAIKSAISDGYTVFVELGGRPVLKGAIDLTAYELGRQDIEVVSVSSPETELFHYLDALWRLGVPIDWNTVHRDDFARKVGLPSTPLEGIWVALTKPGELPGPKSLPGKVSIGSSTSADDNASKGIFADAAKEDTVRSVGHYHANSTDSERSLRPIDLATPYAEPLTEAEIQLSEIFGRTVSIAGVGADDNLFDIGGTSLMLVHIANFIRDGFGINVSIREIIENPTPRCLARLVAHYLEKPGAME